MIHAETNDNTIRTEISGSEKTCLAELGAITADIAETLVEEVGPSRTRDLLLGYLTDIINRTLSGDIRDIPKEERNEP